MKKTTLWSLIVFGLLITANCFAANEKQFTLNGNVKGLDGQKIILFVGSNKDTTTIVNGKFVFTGTLPHAALSAIVVGEYSMENQKHITNFFLEPGVMELTLPTDSFPGYTMTGCAAEDENKSYKESMALLIKEATAVYQQMKTETDHAKSDSLGKVQEALNERMLSIQKDFIMSHPSSWVAVSYVPYISSSISYEELKKIYENFVPEIQQSKEMEETVQELKALEAVQSGKIAPNIAKKDINNKDFNLSSLKGNVILLDFWASWCRPCRASNPHVKALYEKYHAKGFEVVMVSDDDSHPEAWRRAVKQDGLEKFHHVLRGLKQNPAGSAEMFDRSEDISESYAIHSLPTKYLIDKDLKIVGKLTDEELDGKLKELFGE